MRSTLILAFVLLGTPTGAEDSAPTGPPPLALSGPKPAPVAAPAAGAVEGAIGRGVQFLLRRQNKDGSWGSADAARPYNVYAPVPGAHQAFHAAVTALCISALIEAGGSSAEVSAAIERGEQWLLEHLEKVRRATPDTTYNNWTHAYAIQALLRMRARRPEDSQRRRRIGELIRQQIDMLDRYECVDGGWAYYDFKAHTQRPSGSSMSFLTATVLVALAEAKQAGFAPPERLVKRGIESLRRQRKPDFSYCYGEYLKYTPMHPVNLPGGSLGRSQACNLAMRRWGDEQVTVDVLKTWLDRLFARNLWLDLGRKHRVPHDSWFYVAGYFFYYGHYYAALSIDELPPSDRPPYQDHLAHVLLPLQEKDGSWWDFPLYDYHQQYGTAFALMALKRCKR